MKIKTVLLDMDGVLVDFVKGVHEVFNVSYKCDDATRYDFWEDWNIIVPRSCVDEKCDVSFWENLNWTQDGHEILHLIEDNFSSIYLISQPMHNSGSWTGKRLWIDHNLPNYIDKLIVTEVPKKVFASPDTLLIDDKDENVDEFIHAGGQAILVPRPWNSAWSNLIQHNVIAYLEEQIKYILATGVSRNDDQVLVSATRVVCESVMRMRKKAGLDQVEEQKPEPANEKMRDFDSGATRSNDPDRLDYEGFISPIVLRRYAQYLHKHRIQADGKLRDSDNWQKGIPIVVYMKSKCRHFIHTWVQHRCVLNGCGNVDEIEESLCAELFNTMGYLFELLKDKKCHENVQQD